LNIAQRVHAWHFSGKAHRATTSATHGDSACKLEIARLWSAIERSVVGINRAQAGAGNMQGKAA
jgi:hypothetical protein